MLDIFSKSVPMSKLSTNAQKCLNTPNIYTLFKQNV